MEPEHALLTGATGQLGSALVGQLAGRCSRLSLCALEDQELKDQATQVANRHGIAVAATPLDVRDPLLVKAWIEACDADMPIDLVVMNAGIGGQIEPGALLESPERTVDLIDANLHGVLHTLHAILPLMQARGHGHLIVVSSLSALIGYDKAPVYAATKAALRVLCLSLRPSLAAQGIGLTVACPGFLDQPMHNGHDGWRPFSITPEAAAAKIVGAGLRGKGQIHFPPAMAAMVRTLSFMPLPVREAVYRQLSGNRTAKTARAQ